MSFIIMLQIQYFYMVGSVPLENQNNNYIREESKNGGKKNYPQSHHPNTSLPPSIRFLPVFPKVTAAL